MSRSSSEASTAAGPPGRAVPIHERPPSYRRAPDEKRERIASAAEGLFASKGFARTTTAEIALQAGVSEGILFHHFKSKRELFAHVASRYARGLVEAMLQNHPEGLSIGPEQAIRNAFAFAREHRSMQGVFAVRDPELADLVHSESRSRVVDSLEQILRFGMEHGQCRPMNPRIVAELCHSLVDGALQACFVEREGEDEEQYVEETIRCIMGALRPSDSQLAPEPDPPQAGRKRDGG